MKVSHNRDNENRVILHVEVPPDRVRKKFDAIYDKISQEAKIPGFRPGKAPRQILEQHHGKTAREEVLKDLISECYSEGIKQENIDAIDMPQITDVKLEQDTLTFSAQVEVKPEIVIKQYKKIKIKRQDISVDPKEVEDYIKQIKQARGADIADDRLAKSLGYRSMEELQDVVTKQLFLKKHNDERARLEKDILRYLQDHVNFALPKPLVDRRIQEVEHNAEQQLLNYGLTEDKARQRLTEMQPRFKAQAEEEVKVFLILEKIAKSENIKSDDHMLTRVMEFLMAEAEWS
jgi:FKBP-type peptidyl-prolyl cis-trans isomerase (trigger factor)